MWSLLCRICACLEWWRALFGTYQSCTLIARARSLWPCIMLSVLRHLCFSSEGALRKLEAHGA